MTQILLLWIEPEQFRLAVGLLALGVGCALFLGLLWIAERRGELQPPTLQTRLGMGEMPVGLFALLGLAWGGLALVLFLGVLRLVLETLFWPVAASDLTNFRWHLAQMAALTTVLGAVIALPITLNRLRITKAASDTAAESLFNDKFAQAAADLYAQRQFTKKQKDGSRFNGWQDDIPRRNAAIDRLEGLVHERPTEAGRVSRLLSVYVRELSREFPPEDVPETEDIEEIQTWAQGLEPVRSDIETAVQVLGRLSAVPDVDVSTLSIDLRRCNLQGFDLSGDGEDAPLHFHEGSKLGEAALQGADLRRAKMQGADLRLAQMQGAVLRRAEMQGADLFWAKMQGADLSGAEMQGADLRGAEMQGADLGGAKMQGADLLWAEMQGAVLRKAQMQGADLRGAQMQGADLRWAEMDETTHLAEAVPHGASAKWVDDTTISHLQGFWDVIFADGSVTLPEGADWPAHWPRDDLDWGDFNTQWRKWQREEMKMTPDGSSIP